MMLARTAAVALIGTALFAGCGAPGALVQDAAGLEAEDAVVNTDGDGDNDRPLDGSPPVDSAITAPYSIVVLPDTQFYAMGWPDVFDAQARWIVDNRDAQGIAFVLHAGDIVDSDTPEQWMNANHSLSLLDGNVPYVLTAGNHDYSNLADRMGMAAHYFPVSRLAQSPTFGGTFEEGHVENNYSLLPAGGGRWLVLSLEFGPRDQVVAWADTILKRYGDVPAMIVTHAYLYAGNVRYDRNGPPQSYSPGMYVMAGQNGSSINDGEDLWRKLILPNHNVQFVFCGHVVGDGHSLGFATGRLTSARPDGSRVHQILANYQYCLGGPCTEVHGGNGYLRLLRISPADRVVHVQTYSPYLDQSLTDDGNQFDLELP